MTARACQNELPDGIPENFSRHQSMSEPMTPTTASKAGPTISSILAFTASPAYCTWHCHLFSCKHVSQYDIPPDAFSHTGLRFERIAPSAAFRDSASLLPATTRPQSLWWRCPPPGGTGRSAQRQSASRPPLADPLRARSACNGVSTDRLPSSNVPFGESQRGFFGTHTAHCQACIYRLQDRMPPHPWARLPHWCLGSHAQCPRTGPRGAAACASSSRSTSSAAPAARMSHTTASPTVGLQLRADAVT